ncbi:MAG: RNA polymerase sigma factor RpoH, partial [Desulfuromonadales bacterium]
MSLPAVAVDNDSFEHYMKQVNRFELLSRDEEIRLARRYRQQDDLEAAHRLTCANLRFVVKVALEYRGYGLRNLDLIQEGNIGLMLAVKKFDPERGIRLISYAVWWIRAYIHNFIVRSWSLVKIGTTQAQKKLFFKLAQARNSLRQMTGTESNEQLAEQLEVREQEVEEMALRLGQRDASLDLELVAGEGFTLLDTLADDRDNQETALMRRQESRQDRRQVQRALAMLNPRERRIVRDRFYTENQRTLQELANDYGISRERVRQIE